MSRRRHALKLAFLTAALGLVALCMVALACAPAAPGGQASGPVEPDATAEATATATTAATNTPTLEPSATAEASGTVTLAPAATVAPAASKVEPMLNALVTQSQSAGAQGASGQTARMVGVVIDPAGATDSVSNANWETLRQLVTDNGGAILGGREYSVPVSLLPQLAVHTAVATMIADRPEDFPYPKLSRALNNVVAVWQAGATPQQAAAAYSPLVYDDKILAFIDVADEPSLSRIGKFFTANKVYVYPERRESALTTLSMMVLVPVPLLASLSQVSGVTEVEDFGLGPLSASESLSPEAKEYLNLFLYGTLPPDLRSQLSPLPTEVWELEGITPTPTLTPTSEPGEARLGPVVGAYVQGQATRQATAQAQGASGQAAPAKTLAVQIFVHDASKRGEVTAFLESHDIAHSPAPGTSHIYATVPVSLVASLAAHSGVNEIQAWPPPYPNLGSGPNALAAEYEAGLMPDEDTNLTFARLVIGIEGGDNYDAVKRFLESKGAVMAFAERDMAEIYRPAGDLVAFVPVAQIVTLPRMAGVKAMWDEGYLVPAEARYTAGSIYDIPTATPTPIPTPTSAPAAANPDRSPTLDAGVSGAAATAPATPTPAPAGANAHGADHWNSAGIVTAGP